MSTNLKNDLGGRGVKVKVMRVDKRSWQGRVGFKLRGEVVGGHVILF